VTKFRYNPRLGVPYHRQGYIYFTARTYPDQPKRVRDKIARLCRACGGEHWRALFEYMTKNVSAVEVCSRFFIDKATLNRTVRAFYRRF